MGHRLTLGFDRWECTTDFTGDEPTAVRLEIDLTSLQVISGEGGVKPLGSLEKRKVHGDALKALHAAQSPRVTWTSTEVAQADGGFALSGTLSLNGQQHDCPVAVRVTSDGDQHAIAATAEVRQTTWGIRPVSQALGTLQVSDVVQVLVEVEVTRS